MVAWNAMSLNPSGHRMKFTSQPVSSDGSKSNVNSQRRMERKNGRRRPSRWNGGVFISEAVALPPRWSPGQRDRQAADRS